MKLLVEESSSRYGLAGSLSLVSGCCLLCFLSNLSSRDTILTILYLYLTAHE